MERITDSEAVEIAWRFQHVTFTHLAMLALMVHEWLILLDREVESVWRSRWGINKILFIVTRYGPFLDMPVTITIATAPYGAIDYDMCNRLYKISTWGSFLGVSISESILLLRTSAIYSGSKRVVIPLSTAYVASVVTGMVITWRYLHSTFFGPPPSPLFHGCYQAHRDPIFFFNFVMLLTLELAFVILTVKKGFRDFHSGTPLLRVVYRDSVAFFLVLFSLTLSVILVLALAPPQYGGLIAASTRVLHSVLCCRILLNLRQAASTGNTSVLEISTDLAFVTSPAKQTDQMETAQLETHGTRGDEEDHRRRVDEEFSAGLTIETVERES